MGRNYRIKIFIFCCLLMGMMAGNTTESAATRVIGNAELLSSFTEDIPTENPIEDEGIKETDPSTEMPIESALYDVENLLAEQKNKTVLLNWDEGYGAKSYIVERKAAGGKYKQLAELTASQMTYTDKTVSYGRRYAYRIKSCSDDNKSKGITVTITVKLPKPSLTVKRQGEYGKLTWKKTEGANGYAIYMAASKNGTYKRIKTIASEKTTAYTKKGLSGKKVYYFKIRTFVKADGVKKYSSYSSTVMLNTSIKDTITEKFKKLQKQYPDGKYWNHKGVSAAGKDISTIVTNKPCSLHISTWSSSCNYYNCPDGTIGYQCHGFAWKMSDLIFGKSASVKKFTSFDKAKVGDVVRIRDVHTIIILEKHSDYVLAGEANVGGTCMICWGRSYTKESLKNSVYYTRY